MSDLRIRAITFTKVFSASHMPVADRYDADGYEWKDWTVDQDEEDGSIWLRHKKLPIAVRVPECVCIIEYDWETEEEIKARKAQEAKERAEAKKVAEAKKA